LPPPDGPVFNYGEFAAIKNQAGLKPLPCSGFLAKAALIAMNQA